MSHNIISVDSTTPDVNSTIQTVEYIQFGRGESPASPSLSIAVGNVWPFYDTEPVNTIKGATLNITNDELDSIDLPAGKYLVWMNTGAAASGTSGFVWAAYYFTNATVQYTTTRSLVGNSGFMTSYADFFLPSYINLSSATRCFARCSQATPSATSTSSRYATTSCLTILRIE